MLSEVVPDKQIKGLFSKAGQGEPVAGSQRTEGGLLGERVTSRVLIEGWIHFSIL